MPFILPMVLIPLLYPAPRTPRTGFQTLPAELKLHIIEKLGHDSVALSRVATCNRELYQMAMPVLYACVSLGAPPQYRIWPGLAWPADRRCVERFLLTILRNPHIAALVKSLDLTALHDLCYVHRRNPNESERRQLILQPLFPQDRQMIMNAGMDLPVYSTNRVLLRQALQPDVPRTDALLAVLLGYLPGLERLEIPIESEDPPGGPPITEPNLIQRVLVSLTGALSTPNSEIGVATSAVEGNTRLPKLTHLKAEVNGDSPSADIDSLMALLRMSTLTHVFGTKWTTTQPWHRPLIADSHHLVHLELRECTFDAQNLRSLLKQAHNLQTLIYERGWTVRKDWRLKASDLIRALQETSQTLACLELSYNRFIRRIQEDLYLQPLNLSGLVHLKRLRISAGYLVQTGVKKELFEGSFWRHFDETGAYNSTLPLHQLLPKSLEQLHIFQIHDELEFTLMSNKLCESLYGRAVPILSEAHQFEHLKEIIIEAPFEDQGAYFFSTLFEVTNRAGVKLTAIENSADYIKSWVTHNSKVSCPSRDINWGFDGEIQWENPFTQRGEVRYHRR